jgi:uncharacterized membrane protein YuzA (DUF378 family)
MPQGAINVLGIGLVLVDLSGVMFGFLKRPDS